MSYTIQVPCAQPPSIEQLIQGVQTPDLRVTKAPPDNPPWPETLVTFHRHLVSNRDTSLNYIDGHLVFTIRALASDTDCELAITLAETAARLLNTHVHPEQYSPMPPEDLRKHLNSEWIQTHQESGARMTIALVQRENGVMRLPGPIRSWCIGPNLLAKVRSNTQEPLHVQMINQMRYVQWVDELEGYLGASVLEFADAPSTPKNTLAIWLPNHRSLVPAVEHVVIDNGSSPIMVPYAKYAELAKDRIRWIDDAQTLVEAYAPHEIPALVQAAKPFDETPLFQQKSHPNPAQPPTTSSPRKWWQFWRPR